MSRNSQEHEGQKTLFNIVNIGVGCIGLIGVLATLIATYFVIVKPQQTITFIQEAAKVPSQEPQIVTVMVPSQEPLPTYTFYPTYTPILTDKPATDSAPPTEIQLTETPAPTATRNAVILFEDDFNDGLDQNWTVESGNPVVVNNTLTADETTWLTIGETSWSNYQIEFETDANRCWIRSDSSNNFIAVRMIDLDNLIAFVWEGCESQWYIREGGEWNFVPHTDGDSDQQMMRLRITVNEDEFVANKNDARLSAFFDARFSQGYIGLRIGPGTIVDNFRVTRIEE